MKKRITLLSLALLASIPAVFAQHIMSSSVLYNEEVHPNQYIFIKSNQKTVEKEWKTYLSKFGKISEDKGQITISAVREGGIGTDLETIISKVEENDDFSVVSVLLLDENNRSLAADQIDHESLEKLFFDFYDLAYYNEELRMANVDLELAEKQNDDAEKATSRAERALTANLKAQEKLGKKLAQSPEELAKIIQDKDEVYQEILKRSEESTESDESLDKEFAKTEKKIVKTKSKAERNAAQLEKREAAFEELTNKLFEARVFLGKTQEILESKKVVIQDLKKAN